RNSALALDFHPVGPGAPLLAAGLDGAGHLDGAAEQQQLLRERGLAGVRVGDDREGPPPGDLVGEAGHLVNGGRWIGSGRRQYGQSRPQIYSFAVEASPAMHDGPHRNGDVDRGSAGSPLLRGRVRGVMVELTGPLGCLAGSVVLALALAVLIAAAVAGLI